jgi:hypothetical protein
MREPEEHISKPPADPPQGFHEGIMEKGRTKLEKLLKRNLKGRVQRRYIVYCDEALWIFLDAAD